MALPPLYKYLSVRGAKLTLGNRTFKHAKPSDFNDTEDLTIQSIFPEETEAALTRLSCRITDVILEHINDIPTCKSPMKEKVELLQQVFRTNPEVANVIRVVMAEEEVGSIYDVEYMRARAEMLVNEINKFMQGYRVLCVTTHKDSEKMWSDYAENHKGIALRIEPSVAKDSKFQLFRPVIYREKRLPLYEDTLELIDSLFVNQQTHLRAMVEKIVYAKTLKWEHESEYRLAIPMRQNEEPWNTRPYHPEEITEMYLGLAMQEADKDDIVRMAQAVNLNIAIFTAKRGSEGDLEFDRV